MADTPTDWESIYDAITKQLLETDENFNFDLYQRTAEELVKAMDAGLKFSSTASEADMMKLQKALRVNLFEFSSAKAQSMMVHYRELMMNQKKEIISFESLRKIVANEGEVFNNAYLKTEYNLTKQSSIMAVKWQELNAEYLQFSTVGDNRVRPEHKLFDKFTALKTDPIWRRLYTPLDFGCRCNVIPGKETGLSKTYDSAWANNVVDPLVKGTMFDNNVGITLEIFNKKHPYYKDVESFNPVEARKEKDKEIKEWAKTNIPDNGLVIEGKNFKTGTVHISRSSIKSIGDHFSAPELKEVAKVVIPNLKNCKHVGSAPLDEKKPNYEKKKAAGVTQFHYYEFNWKSQTFRLNTEDINGKFEKPYAVNLVVKK